MIWHSPVGRGDLRPTVTNTIIVDMTGSLVGDYVVFEIDHNDMELVGETGIYGRFSGEPQAVFTAVGGYHIEPILDGTTGTKFRAQITYVGTPEPIYGYGDEYGYGVVPGKVTLTWSRTGALASDAAS